MPILYMCMHRGATVNGEGILEDRDATVEEEAEGQEEAEDEEEE